MHWSCARGEVAPLQACVGTCRGGTVGVNVGLVGLTHEIVLSQLELQVDGVGKVHLKRSERACAHTF